MKNIKSVISLALLAVAPTIYAQNIDTKAAPDVPTFSVTLNVTNNGGGLDSVFVKKTIETEKDSLILSGTNSLKLTYGATPSFRLKANSQYMLESFTVNGTKVESMNEQFNVLYKDVNSYTYATPAEGLKEKTDIVIKWVEKPEVKLEITGTEQIVNASTAATITVKADGQEQQFLKYYSDVACTKEADGEARKKAGTFYIPVKIPETAAKKAVDRVITMVVNNKTALAVGTAPKCETILMQGQPLSAAVITGGKVTVDRQTDHVIKGTWSWADPNALVEAGAASSKTYAAIFTPDSAAVYNTVTAEIGVGAKPVKIVTVNQTAGGVVAITNASADNKYIGTNVSTNPTITVTATPDAGYQFSKWAWAGTSTPSDSESESKVTATDKEITANTVVSAVFEKATRKITITSPTGSDGNSLKVLNGTQEVATDTDVPVGTTLTIVATPGEGQEVEKVEYTLKKASQDTQSDDLVTEATSFIVSGAAGNTYTIAATFKTIEPNQYLVSVDNMTNGALKLKQGETAIAPNSSVEKDSYVSIIALPNKGYKLATLKANGVNIKDASGLTVTKETTIAATFEKETYPVSVVTPEGVSINVQSGSKAFETSLGAVTVTETDPDNYRLINLLVNNKPVANGSEVIVNGPTNISAQVKKLAPLSILNDDKTTVTYSGKAQEYAVKTTANLGGFSVKYLLNGTKDTIPTGVGTYTVVITRPADDVYAATKVNRTLVIEPGVPGIKMIPFAEAATGSEIASTATVAGIWTKTKPTKAVNGLRAADDDLQTVYFIPTDNNLMTVTAVTPKDQTTANSLAASVKLPTVSNGSIVLMNGDIAVAAGQSVYKGQELTIKLIPDAGFMIGGTLTGTGLTFANDVYTLTLAGDHEINVTTGELFKQKTPITAPNGFEALNSIEKFYAVSPIELNVTDLTLPDDFPTDKWIIFYKLNDNVVTPTNVVQGNGYDIYVSRDEDDKYQAFKAAKIGKLTVKPAVITKECVTVPTATAITKGETLLASSLTGGSVLVNGISVSGTFAWASVNELINQAGDKPITFTPTDNLNYSTTSIQEKLYSYVSLKDASSYVMTLKKVNDGAITITDAAGTTIDQNAPSIKIAAGMKLFIKTAATGTKIDKIVVVPETTVRTETTGDKQVWSFEAPSQDFAVTVTFTKESTSEGGDTPEEGVAVTGISLNKTTLTLPRLKSEKLVATVTPTGATKKDVKWTSTNPEIATVDADGTVKAVKYGQATIIATTVDGGFTAMCQVNVDFATAIEKILSESLVYSRNGQIIIEPAAPVEISIINLGGQVIYNNSISSTIQVPANNGVYIVRMAAAGKATTTKVIVR
ncbi:T9SS C-terminal target domain-containing protein [Parabacteroides sp. AF48-14]|uniref:Ig-like domain-containing protein n=1 Tax=Parabacteroides sp. AF48-14 TaxID=2292052 RepID=UPI000EFFD290|nr:Ig-like domain-containing protein [Parabacteroides sp. AF48-14]RHO71836.1 T9SS C-terminal target domain-containing protein [Parabacteroides sp. AF48-14]